MKWSYRLFRVAGISVELHLTFLLFFALILLGAGVQALMFFAIIFTVVLAHEMIHSLTAMIHGIQVPKITLLPIGGLASIELPEDPLLELKVSAAGPMFNFLLAGIGGALLVLSNAEFIGYDEVVSSIFEGTFSMGSVSGILSVLISVNLILGAFNMLPAFPMDGGRVFRGVLALWMDYGRATRVATMVGQFIFLTLAFLGLLMGNLWWIIIGVFLSYAGSSEMKYANLRRMVRGIRLRDIAVPHMSYANKNLSWRDFMELVYRPDRRKYLLVDSDGMLSGVLDLNDVERVDAESPVGDTEGSDYVVLEADTNVEDALKTLLSKKLALVADEGRIIGYVTPETVSTSTSYVRLTGA